MWTVEYYETEKGEIPVYNFLNELPSKMRTKAFRGIGILQEKGIEIREPHSKHIQHGVYELRIKFSNDISRIFYFFYTDKKIILTNGFIKKTKKTPTLEIEKALEYKRDYERRNQK